VRQGSCTAPRGGDQDVDALAQARLLFIPVFAAVHCARHLAMRSGIYDNIFAPLTVSAAAAGCRRGDRKTVMLSHQCAWHVYRRSSRQGQGDSYSKLMTSELDAEQRRKIYKLTEPKAHHPVVPPQNQAEDIVDLDAQLPRGRHDDGVRARLPRHARRDALRRTKKQLVWRHDCDCQCHEFADMQPSTRQITGEAYHNPLWHFVPQVCVLAAHSVRHGMHKEAQWPQPAEATGIEMTVMM